jgi:hypothetical protein
MTREELDALWNRSVNESIKAGDSYARYRYAEYVAAAEREACAKLCDGWTHADGDRCAAAIRARGSK